MQPVLRITKQLSLFPQKPLISQETLKTLCEQLNPNEEITCIHECLFNGILINDREAGISGLIFVTSIQLLFIPREKSKMDCESLPFNEITSLFCEKIYSDYKVIVHSWKGNLVISLFGNQSSIKEFILDIQEHIDTIVSTGVHQSTGQPDSIKKPAKSQDNIIAFINNFFKGEPEKDYDPAEADRLINELTIYNFLFQEAKKIHLILKEIKNLREQDDFYKEFISDLITIAVCSIFADNVLSIEEKMFLSVVMLPLYHDNRPEFREMARSMFDLDSFPIHFQEGLNQYWNFILPFLKLKSSDVKSLILPSLQTISKYDKANGTVYTDKIKRIYLIFAECFIKSDGKVTPAEQEVLKILTDSIYPSIIKTARNTKSIKKRVTEKTVKTKKRKSAESLLPEQEEAGEGIPDDRESACKPDEENLEQVIEQLEQLIGMTTVKEEIKQLINFIIIQEERKQRNLPATPISLHSVFYGPPGTGKTTVARLLGKIFKCLGILKKGHVIETDRAGLVAGYVGQTAIKTDEMIQKALDGVLFIDEAYTLSPRDDTRDFGQEAVEIILKRMEDFRGRLIIIAAGYPDEMDRFISSNPGLKSRFNRYFHFDHYTPCELFAIFELFCKNSSFILSDSADKKLKKLFTSYYENRDKFFGNGRVVRNIFEKTIERQANRLVSISPLTDKILSSFTAQDIPGKK